VSEYLIAHCEHCEQPLSNHARELIAGKVARAATVNRRNPDASHNEMATEIRAAEDCIDPRSAAVDPRRAVGFIEFKPGEEPDRFDEAWEGGRHV